VGFESKSEEAVKALLSEQDFLSLLLVATDQFSSVRTQAITLWDRWNYFA